MSIVVGIDLGTSNSVVAQKGVSVRILKNQEGEELTPSSVTFMPPEQGEQILVGRPSLHMAKQFPNSTVRSVKRLMGHEFEDIPVQNMLQQNRLPYKVVTEPTEPGSVRVEIRNKLHSPEEISSKILEKLLTDSQNSLQTKIDRAVVTVPAYFSDRQKFATRAACQLAGISLLRLLPEPTAAALSFGLGQTNTTDNSTVMVFDLGGGTFDVSILNVADGHFLEVTKGGDMWLGGDDVDNILLEHCLTETQKNYPGINIKEAIENLSTEKKARCMLELKEACEKAKIKLSTQNRVQIELFGLANDPSSTKNIDVDVEISKDQFNELLKPLADRLKSITTTTLHGIGYEKELIDKVVMVGGSSSIPLFQDTMKEMFGAEKVLVHPRPMLAIAEGAAIMANKLASKEELPKDEAQLNGILHAASHSYYLQLAEGQRVKLMERNTPLPYEHEEILQFQHENQNLARLRILNEVDGLLETVGEMWVYRDGNLPNFNSQGDRKKLSLKLKFEIDEDNIVRLGVSSLNSDTHKLDEEHAISRGGLAVKFRNDIESILSQALSLESDAHSSRLLQLSKIPNRTILEMTNPFTGILNQSLRKIATLQIETLRQLSVTPELAIISISRLAEVILDLMGANISTHQKNTIESLMQKAEIELQTFSNAKEILAAYNAIADYLRRQIDQEIFDVGRFLLMTSSHEFTKDRARLKELATQYASYAYKKDTTNAKIVSKNIEEILSAYRSSSETAAPTFYRDVVRAQI